MKIIHEDEAVIVIHKEPGEPVQSAGIGTKDCVSMLKNHLAKAGSPQKGEPYLGVIHRLDQPVEGLLVFAKTEKAAAKLSAQINDRSMSKKYHAVVEGIPKDNGPVRLTDMIYKDARTNKSMIGNAKDAKKAELIYTVESADTNSNTAVLVIELLTGRFHQIRAQLSHLGYPIAGDVKYGAAPAGTESGDPKRGEGIALIADRLEFVHPITGKREEFSVVNGTGK